MKLSLKLVLAFLLCSIPLYMTSAQEGDKRSQQILKDVADKTRAYETIRVKFSYEMDNKDAGIHESYEGGLLIRGDMYRLNIGGQTVICDGKTIWTYIEDAEEVQIHTLEDNKESISPSTLLTSYHKDYRSKLIREGMENGINSYIIDLVPISGKSFFKVRIIIDKKKMHITSFSIYERNGSTFTYKILEFVPNVAAEVSKFSFTKKEFPDADIIDMR